MGETPAAVTALMASMIDNRLRAGMARLLHTLRDHLRAYPRDRLGKLEDHDIVWMTDLKGGPEKAIMDAVKMNPEMWAGALPAEVCIVPRSALASLGVKADHIEYLEGMGASIVDTQARRLQYEAEHDDCRARDKPFTD